MRSIFLCHCEEDVGMALDCSAGLEEAGYSTWYYERDTLPGESYLIQIGRAIEDSRCVVLIVSRRALVSAQMTSEVVRAFEARRPFIPLLHDVTHEGIAERQPIWRQALVTSTSLAVPAEGVESILGRVVKGLEALGIHPEDGSRSRELLAETRARIEDRRAGAGATPGEWRPHRDAGLNPRPARWKRLAPGAILLVAMVAAGVGLWHRRPAERSAGETRSRVMGGGPTGGRHPRRLSWNACRGRIGGADRRVEAGISRASGTSGLQRNGGVRRPGCPGGRRACDG